MKKMATFSAKPGSDLEEQLISAAVTGDTSRITEALSEGANVNSVNEDFFTALAFASFYGHDEVVKILFSG